MHDILIGLTYYLQCSLFAYEFTGYGPSRVNATDKYVIADIHTAYKFVREKLGYKWHNIIL